MRATAVAGPGSLGAAHVQAKSEGLGASLDARRSVGAASGTRS